MSKETNNDSLQKANSAAKHLARMSKAASSFHDQMSKLHKAHHDDMQSACSNLAKVLGVGDAYTEGGGVGEVKGEAQVPAGGTQNIQDFGKAAAAPVAAAAQETFTKAEVESLIEDTLSKFVDSLTKAKGGKGKPNESSSSSSSSSSTPANKAAKPNESSSSSSSAAGGKKTSKGIGSRAEATPVTRTTPVFKAMEGMPNLQQPTAATPATQAEREALVVKAASGDQEAVLQLMKGVKMIDGVPDTLVAPLSKIH